jgi:RimJ/RimL family protein N-acetyltransferase
MIDVVPVTAEHVHALISDPDTFAARFGLTLVPGYLAFPEALPATLDALRDGMPPEWSSHLIVDTAAGEVVGFGGFTGRPEGGSVEIGYSVAPERRGRGHATAAVRAWVERARAAGLQQVVAHTLAAENPSTRVLHRVGFRRAGETVDPDEGTVWRWALELQEPG